MGGETWGERVDRSPFKSLSKWISSEITSSRHCVMQYTIELNFFLKKKKGKKKKPNTWQEQKHVFHKRLIIWVVVLCNVSYFPSSPSKNT